ncbi:hypothetical protein G4G27_13815 [Sphingomonas sp. So64.6b]|uniref:hypothetical protein n=1 Tax=Sphingomonas sp. So64.6b TaxID=2997354 RepID=UPI0015FED948|nr:hypothetical protein [Sphingomonas sp. So64.6b]QNA84951.1 hypothetical protein G4G27_13815 [Sphingomonas sp. So64.6b]
MKSPYRPEFEAALLLLARISEAMARQGLSRPILVGGGAVEYYSGSAIATGDFDLCSTVQPELEAEMQRHGFVGPSGPGLSTRGWIHPELRLGFEIVGSVPLDGNVDRDHILLIEDVADGQSFAIIAVEDLIADRMGQYASGTARDRLDQARALFRLHPDVDLDYLERRIRQETFGDHGLEAFTD